MAKRIINIFICILLFILGLAFFHSPGTIDTRAFEGWANNADRYGLTEGFKQNKDNYPPLALVIVYISSQISKPFDLNNFEAVKLAIFLFLLISSFVFWLFTRNFLLTVILYISMFLNSIMQGYIDIFIVPSLILAFWALDKKRITLFSVAFTITCLIKWQALIITPFLIVHLFDIQSFKEWKNINYYNLFKRVFIPAFLILIFVVVIFNFIVVKDAFIKAFMHKHLSGLALNLNWMYTYILHIVDPKQFPGLVNDDRYSMIIRTDQLKITLLPRIIFLVAYCTILVKFFKTEKRFENLLLYTILGYFAYFLFNVGVHENHLFPIVILSLLLFTLNKKYLMLTVCIILMFNINLWIFGGLDGTYIGFNKGIWPISFMLSFINLLLFFIFIDDYLFHFNVLIKLKQSFKHSFNLAKR